jgi:hypothetical protein
MQISATFSYPDTLAYKWVFLVRLPQAYSRHMAQRPWGNREHNDDMTQLTPVAVEMCPDSWQDTVHSARGLLQPSTASRLGHDRNHSLNFIHFTIRRRVVQIMPTQFLSKFTDLTQQFSNYCHHIATAQFRKPSRHIDWLRAARLRDQSSSLLGSRISLLRSVQNDIRTHLASIPMGPTASFPNRGVKLATRLRLVPRSRKRGSTDPPPPSS